MKKICIVSILLLSLFSCNSAREPKEDRSEFWPNATFEEAGLDREPMDTFLQDVEDGLYGNVDRLLLIKNGKKILDEAFRNNYQKISEGKSGLDGCGYNTCEDSTAFGEYNYFHPFWHPYYKNREVHTLQSISKSISSLLIGIAIDQGKISSTDALLVDFLSDYDLGGVDSLFTTATLENLLTMRLGMEWHEIDATDMDSTNTTLMLEHSDDWIRFTLDQPMDTVPGTTWVYNSGASQLMSVIIKKATGLYADEYAEENLFGPMGITDYHWKKSPDGYPDALGGVYLAAEDLAKIGQLIQNKGEWDGKQVVSGEWVERSTARISDTTQVADYGYGYQWWRPDQEGVDVIAGFGYGGQTLLIFPEFNMQAVVYSWNVFGEDVKSPPSSIIKPLIKSNVSGNSGQ